MSDSDKATFTGFSLYDKERQIIEDADRELGFGNKSAALRFILHDWARQRFHVLTDTPAEYRTNGRAA